MEDAETTSRAWTRRSVNQRVGAEGESIAARYLVSRGYRVLMQNWRHARGEIDIIAMDGACMVAVEVKTRRGLDYGAPLEAITYQKAKRLRRLLYEWLRAYPGRPRRIRIDGIGITLRAHGAPKIEHVEGIA